MALVAAMFAVGAILFVGCGKEGENNDLDNPIPKSITNPYSYVGTLHNIALYDIGVAIQDSLDFYANLGTLTSGQRERLASLVLQTIPKVTRDYDIMQMPDSTLEMAMNFAINSLNAEYVDSLFLGRPVSTIIAKSLSEIDFSKSIDVIQAELQKEIENMLLDNNDEAAIFLTVMSYSISFWDEAQMDQNNPWFNFVNKYTFVDDAKSLSKGFLRDAFNAVKGWWNKHIRHEQAQEIPRAVEIALCDAAGAATGAPVASLTGFTSVIFGAVIYSGLAVIFA